MTLITILHCQFVLFMLSNTVHTDYDFLCPYYSQWNYKRKGSCQNDYSYFCLFDQNNVKYTEFCRKKPEFQRPGYKFVIRGSIDGSECSENLFQPIKFWTNGSSDCIFQKILCKEEGQIVFENGNPKTDRSCRCDYTKGYAFVEKPHHTCFCAPGTEDCSCYIKKCPPLTILTPDYQCVHIEKLADNYECKLHEVSSDNNQDGNQRTAITIIDTNRYVTQQNAKRVFGFTVGVMLLACVFIWKWKYAYDGWLKFRQCTKCNKKRKHGEAKKILRLQEKMLVLEKKMTELPPSIRIRRCLRMLYNQLVNQIDPLPIAQILEQKKLITSVDMDEITKALQRTKRNHILLRKIWNGNEQIYHAFTQALRHDSSLTDLAEQMESLGCIANTVVDDIDDLEEKENEKIPQNLKDNHKKHIKEWIKNDKKFVETNMSTKIANALSISNIIFVVGSTGHGKTSIIRHVALTFSSNHGYDIIPDVDNPNTITEFYQPGRKQIFIVDNIGGRDHINLESVKAWAKHLETIKNLVDEGSKLSGANSGHQTKCMLKVLISCEKEIFEITVFKDFKFLKDNIRYLSNWEFSNEERMNMIRKYSEIGEDSSIYNNCTELPFPLLCRLTVGMSKSQIKTFFKTPLKHIRNEFESMHQTDKHKFFLITLCVVFNDGFAEDQLSKCFHGNAEEKITDLCKEFNFDTKNEKTYPRIVEKLNVLKQTYIHYENDRYSLIHNTIYGIAATVCGHRYFDFFISYGSCKFIAQRYKLNSCACTDEIDLIPIEKEKKYFNRLIKDLEDGNTNSTFENKQLDNPEYRVKLIKYFNEWDSKIREILSKIKTLTQNRDERTYLNSSKNDNTSFMFNRSPLMQSARKGYEDIVSMLLKMGCEINETDFHKKTPLYIAASCGRQEVVNVLLNNKADITLCDINGKSPLYAASREGHAKIIDLLITKSDVDKCDNNGRSPLYVASEAGHKLVVELLLSKKAQLTINDNTGASPLFVATQRGKNEVVKYLIHEGAEVNHCDNEGRSPLFIACEEGHIDLVEILLDNKANPSSCDLHGRSPLYMAAKTGNNKVVKLLLSENSETINSIDDNDWTPLFVACNNGHTTVVQSFLEYKSDVKFCDRLGLSPLHVACSKGYIDIVQLLLPRSSVNKADKSNRTSLYAACKAGNADIAKLLLDNKADINIKNKWGASVLFVACREGHQHVVNVLLKRNFDINKCDTNFMPLHIACEEGFLQIVDILIKNGAKINRLNQDQKTPLDIAFENRHDDIVKCLLSKHAKRTQGKDSCKQNN